MGFIIIPIIYGTLKTMGCIAIFSDGLLKIRKLDFNIRK